MIILIYGDDFLYDEGYITFIDYSEAKLQNRISLKVIRDIKGRVDKLIEVA